MGGRCCRGTGPVEPVPGTEQEGMELVSRSIDESSSAIISTMRIEVRLKCEGLPPISGRSDCEKFVLSYKVEYGNTQQGFKWTEKYENDTKPKCSKPYNLPYEMGTDQTMRISIYRYEDVKELRDPQHRPPYGSALFDLNEAIVAKNHDIRKRVATVDDQHKNDETYLTLSVTEKKQENLAQLVMQMEVQGSRLKGPLYFTCYQQVGDGLKFIKQSENAFSTKKTPHDFAFEPLVLSSEAFEGAWEEKTLEFVFEDGSSSRRASTIGLVKGDNKSLATCSVSIRDLVQTSSSPLQELPIKTKNKKFGKLVVTNRNVEPILTLGSILFSNVKLVPIIAVDCSLGNLTFDSLKCMHHFDKIRPNMYIEALNAIESKVYPFYSKMLSYGFGAKVVPKKSRLSSCFSLNGNIFDPMIRNREELVSSYIKTIKSVELCLPVNYCEVIRTAKGLAQYELNEYRRKYRYNQHNLNSSNNNLSTPMLNNYYVLYIVTAGVLDDAEEAFAECSNIVDLPMSIVFVKIGNQQMRDVDDLSELQHKIEQSYCQHRKFVSTVEFDRVYNDLPNFGKFLVSSVPAQALQFFKLAQRRMSGSASPDFPSTSLGESSGKADEKQQKVAALEEEDKEGLKQQGLNPAVEDNYIEYFEKLKLQYYQKMREKSTSASDVEAIIKRGIPDNDPDLPMYLVKKTTPK